MLKKTCIEFIYVCVFLSSTLGFERNVTSWLNYGCQSSACNSSKVTLLYVNAVGDQDTIHQIWDFTRSRPTIVYAVTKSPIVMSIEWEQNKPFSFHVPETIMYAFSIVIDKIWEFNDLKDSAMFDPSESMKQKKAIETSCFNWDRLDLVESTEQVMVEMQAHGCDSNPGNLTVKLNLLPFTDYSFDLPHLIHSSNSTQVDIVLDNLTTTPSYNSSRFALEMLIISEEKTNGSVLIQIRKGLDDEHTPGIFEIVEILTPSTADDGKGGFVQYRPVTYAKPERDVETSRNVSIVGPLSARLPHNYTADLFFAHANPHRLVEKVFVTLGSRGDGFYNSTKYDLWTFTMGYGSPPTEGFSMFVILVMSIGLGVPVLLMLLGGIYVCRKRTASNNAERLRD